LSLFCGEALPASLAAAWARAAPGSVVDNLYGPTEATIACTVHRFEPADEPEPSGLVPIGSPLGSTRIRVVDEALREVVPGDAGELAVGGPQVVEGYLDDGAATVRAFVTLPGLGPAYLTGDRVRAGPDGELVFLGRLDTQIKVLGHRVELEEIEAVIREEAGLDAIAVGWPHTETGAAGIVAVVAGRNVDIATLCERLSDRLPDYMLPREVRVLSELPLNANGKRDRRAAAALLETV
jgi:acyl-CoA synthetase (AMP-forming)/AMP-acid ligase II